MFNNNNHVKASFKVKTDHYDWRNCNYYVCYITQPYCRMTCFTLYCARPLSVRSWSKSDTVTFLVQNVPSKVPMTRLESLLQHQLAFHSTLQKKKNLFFLYMPHLFLFTSNNPNKHGSREKLYWSVGRTLLCACAGVIIMRFRARGWTFPQIHPQQRDGRRCSYRLHSQQHHNTHTIQQTGNITRIFGNATRARCVLHTIKQQTALIFNVSAEILVERTKPRCNRAAAIKNVHSMSNQHIFVFSFGSNSHIASYLVCLARLFFCVVAKSVCVSQSVMILNKLWLQTTFFCTVWSTEGVWKLNLHNFIHIGQTTGCCCDYFKNYQVYQ